jgi:hypothetical protein
MDDWTKRFVARGLASNRSNRENEVADAALRSPGDRECVACQKKDIFGERMILFIDTNL